MNNNIFNNKYSKVLTVILVLVMFAIVGLLAFFGIDVYRKYYIEKESKDAVNDFENAIKNPNGNTNTVINTDTNIITGDVPQQNVVIPDIDFNTINQGNTNTVGSSSSGSDNKVKYKGYDVIGTIKIPKTNIEYLILDQVSIRSLEASIGYIYGQGLNQVGNAVLVGHNYRNGTFFSNNKKLNKGDEIIIKDSTGKTVTYVVTKKYETSTGDFDYATRDVEGKRQISLSTCTDNTKKRLIIWAEEK